MLNTKIAWFDSAKYSVRVIGKYSMVAPGDNAWGSLNIEHYVENGMVLPHDFDVEIPAPPTKEEIITNNSQLAKQTRDDSVSADMGHHAALWQCLDDAKDIRKVINDAETIGSADNDMAMFRLADNTWRETSLSELREVLIAFVIRKRGIWEQFVAWDGGDKLTAFEVE